MALISPDMERCEALLPNLSERAYNLAMISVLLSSAQQKESSSSSFLVAPVSVSSKLSSVQRHQKTSRQLSV